MRLKETMENAKSKDIRRETTRGENIFPGVTCPIKIKNPEKPIPATNASAKLSFAFPPAFIVSEPDVNQIPNNANANPKNWVILGLPSVITLNITGKPVLITAAAGATLAVFPNESPLYNEAMPNAPDKPANAAQNMLLGSSIPSPRNNVAAIKTTIPDKPVLTST